MVVQLYYGYGGGGLAGERDVRVVSSTGNALQAFDTSIPLATRTSFDSQSSGARQFATFCLERNEALSFGVSYNATLSNAAFSGGFNTDAGDAIAPETAYLFTQFANGTLSNYDYGTADGAANSLRDSDAAALQSVIWWLEGEIDPIGAEFSFNNYDPLDAGLASVNLSKQAFKWWQEAVAAGWTDIGNVRVMNLWDGNTGAAVQNQLTLSFMIPAPGAALLGMFGLTAIAVRRRKNR